MPFCLDETPKAHPYQYGWVRKPILSRLAVFVVSPRPNSHPGRYGRLRTGTEILRTGTENGVSSRRDGKKATKLVRMSMEANFKQIDSFCCFAEAEQPSRQVRQAPYWYGNSPYRYGKWCFV